MPARRMPRSFQRRRPATGFISRTASSIPAVLMTPLDAKRNKRGSVVVAKTTQDIAKDGEVVLKKWLGAARPRDASTAAYQRDARFENRLHFRSGGSEGRPRSGADEFLDPSGSASGLPIPRAQHLARRK